MTDPRPATGLKTGYARVSTRDQNLDLQIAALRAIGCERELLIERTQAGLEVTKAQGRVGGRKRAMTESKLESAKKLLASGEAPRDVAANLGVSLPTLYRWIPASGREDS